MRRHQAQKLHFINEISNIVEETLWRLRSEQCDEFPLPLSRGIELGLKRLHSTVRCSKDPALGFI